MHMGDFWLGGKHSAVRGLCGHAYVHSCHATGHRPAGLMVPGAGPLAAALGRLHARSATRFLAALRAHQALRIVVISWAETFDNY